MQIATTYRAVMLTQPGGSEVLKCVELPIELPGPGQLRVRVRAAGVGSTDLMMLAGSYTYAPKIPFVPGYEIAGVVDAIGGANIGRCIGAARRGGIVVGYGFMAVPGLPATAAMFFNLLVDARLRGRRGRFYGITSL
jgi:NADPH2:quinone reductase